MVERRRNVRSSIADLRVLYANQMQNLHTTIEGSSKFVPTTPGRHVIVEMDNILALNPATYKVDHAVRFVVLDDAVLVARRRKRRNNAESDKLIAERCWPLNEMLVLDTKDTSCKFSSFIVQDQPKGVCPAMTNVFKIRYNKETLVYRTEIAADKKQLLVQFRHVAEELAAKRRKEREGEHQRRKSFWVGGDVIDVHHCIVALY
jgi:exocyst complex component 8